MRTLKITTELVTPCFLAAEMGEMLYQLIQRELRSYPEIELDFSEYNYISETFLYHSIGKLCLENKWDEKIFKQKIHVVHLEEDDREEFENVLNNVQIQIAVTQQ